MVGRHTHALKRQSIQPSRTAQKKVASPSPQTQLNRAQLNNDGNDEQSKSSPTESSSLEQGGSLLHKIQPAMDAGQPSPSALMSQLGIQAKMTIGESNDKYEQEADRVSRAVVQRLQTSATGLTGNSGDTSGDNDNDSIQRKPLMAGMRGNSSLQMPPPISRLQAKPAALQRREAVDGGDASPGLETAINRAQSGGQPLDTGTQTSMGQAMGANFSGVRIHTDTQSDRLNRAVQARAFTTGSHIFFKQGEYNPGSRGGQELIAHELTHVVQQNGSGVESNINRSPQDIIQRHRLKFGDEDGMFGAVSDLADIGAAHMGTGDTGPTFEAVSDGLGIGGDFDPSTAPSSDIALGSGSAKIGGGVSVAHVGGALGASVNILSTCRGVRDLIVNIYKVSLAEVEIQAAEAEMRGGEAGLKTAVTILEKEKKTANFNIGLSFGDIVSGLNGIGNGVTTFWAAFSSAPGAVAAVSAGTFLAGAGLGTVLGLISAVRNFAGAYRKTVQITAIQKSIQAYEGLAEKYTGQIQTNTEQLEAWDTQVDENFRHRQAFASRLEELKGQLDEKIAEYEDFEEQQQAGFQGNPSGAGFKKIQALLQSKKEEIEAAIKPINNEIRSIDEALLSIEDPDPTAVRTTQEEIALKGQQVPVLAQMIDALTTSSSRHEADRADKLVAGTFGAVGAAGAAALTIASTIGATAALATPIGWGLAGAVAVGALVYAIGKRVNNKIKKSNLIRMDHEKDLLKLYLESGNLINVGTVSGFSDTGDPIAGAPDPNPEGREARKAHKWYRKNFPTKEKKGWFNKLISKKKDGKVTIEERLDIVTAYMTKYGVSEDTGEIIFAGIVDALTTPQGSEEVTVGEDGQLTVTLSDAIGTLLLTKGIDADELVADIDSWDDRQREKVKEKIVAAMKVD